jgi:hypothetical protein
MTAMLQNEIALEKTPLERYVPPAKPSLAGLSRAALADALAAIGVPESQRKMRVQQIWHWLYVRGAREFEQMSSVSKDLRAELDAHYTLARPEVAAEQVSATARANGCCACRARPWASGRTRSSASTFPKPIAARCASPARSAARSIARSATPARSGWCATSRPARSSARSWWRATGWAISLAPGAPTVGPGLPTEGDRSSPTS